MHGLPKQSRPPFLRNFKRIRVSKHQVNRHPDFIALTQGIQYLLKDLYIRTGRLSRVELYLKQFFVLCNLDVKLVLLPNNINV